jgi:hypothetical protein
VTDKECLAFRRAARLAAGGPEAHAVPVEVIPGSSEAPKYSGERGHYTTPGGKAVHFPSAYRMKGRTVYHRSTEKVTVGELWRPPVVWQRIDGRWHLDGTACVSDDTVSLIEEYTYVQAVDDDPPTGARCDKCVVKAVTQRLTAPRYDA